MKSCLAEEHRISQNLRPLPSHYLVLREKLINSLFLIYSYLHIEFQRKRNMRADCGDMAGAAYVSTAAKYGFRRGGLRLLSGENRAVSGKIAG